MVDWRLGNMQQWMSDTMTRTSLVNMLVLAFAAATPACSHADTYRCQLPTGKLEYRDTPCPLGAQRVIDTSPAQVSATPRPGAELEHRASSGPLPRTPDLYSFAHMTMSVRQALEGLGADGSLRVVVDPSITAVGFFDYHNVLLPDLLADIARRFSLDIRNENGVITARPR